MQINGTKSALERLEALKETIEEKMNATNSATKEGEEYAEKLEKAWTCADNAADKIRDIFEI